MWNRSLQDAFHQGKRTVGNIWNHAVKFAGQLDHVVGVSRRAFGALQEPLHALGGERVNRAVMQGIQGYEQGRNEIMGHHNKVQAQLSHLRGAAPELDL